MKNKKNIIKNDYLNDIVYFFTGLFLNVILGIILYVLARKHDIKFNLKRSNNTYRSSMLIVGIIFRLFFIIIILLFMLKMLTPYIKI